MKKLITAAIAASVGLAFAGTDCELSNPRYCAYAYRVKLVGKTVVGVEKKADSECSTDVCWAKPKSFRAAGYIYNDGSAQEEATCDCECECTGHWDLADNSCVFWDSDKKQIFADVTSVEIDAFDVFRNLGAKNIAQIGIKLGDLYLAGFGKFNPETGRLKNASGCFAGTMDKPVCNCGCDDAEDQEAFCYTPCSCVAGTEIACEKAVTFGRWRMAWKSEKVALLKSGKDALTPGVCVPAAFAAKQ